MIPSPAARRAFPVALRRFTLVGIMALSALVAHPSLGQEQEDLVIARINGEPFHLSQVDTDQPIPPEIWQTLDPAQKENIINVSAANYLAAQAALNEGLDQTPAIAAQIEASRIVILRQAWIENQINTRISADTIQQSYDSYLQDFETETQYRVRHVLTETEEEAQEIISKLDAGEDFVTLAQEYSIGPSSSRGGDLGFIAPSELVESVGTAITLIAPGTYTKSPVQSQFGWHVLTVLEIRESSPLPFEQAREQIVSALVQDLLGQLTDELLSSNTIDQVES
ncbi:MAG: peptidyl-prolyl cis-trans isomerase [Pseudomonadota bacterium]